MRRLLRILVNGLTMLSLLLCLAFAALWLRSYWRCDVLSWGQRVRYGEARPYFFVSCGRGGVGGIMGLERPKRQLGWARDGWRWESYDNAPIPYAGGLFWQQRGFAFWSGQSPWGDLANVVFPTGLAVAVFALLPAARGALYVRRRRRAREGHCKKCGYDLRATPGRCPECGAPASPTPAARKTATSHEAGGAPAAGISGK